MSLALFTAWLLTSIEMLHQLVARLLIPLEHSLKQLSALLMPTTQAMPLGALKLKSVITRYSRRQLIASRHNRHNNPLRFQGKKSGISTGKHTVSAADEVKCAIWAVVSLNKSFSEPL